jgi:predicted Zn-ribbon and HTH transcriptional regulator
MESIQRAKLSAGLSHLPPSERGAVSIWCPKCQSDQILRSRMRGIVESLMAFLLIRPYQCEECDHRFFRWSIRYKAKPIRLAWTNE